MSLVRRMARPLLAAPFIMEGVRTAMRPEREIDVYPAAFEQIDHALEDSPVPSVVDARTIVRASGAIAAAAGLAYATNRAPRAAAAVLLVTTSVGWAGRRKVWELRGEARMEEIHAILRDAGLLGGVLLAVVDHDGRPSLGYRVEKLVERGQKNAAQKQRELEKKAGKVKKSAQKKGRKASKGSSKSVASAKTFADDLQKDLSKKASELSSKDSLKKLDAAVAQAIDSASKSAHKQLR
ncbi:MAG: hypothetical protein Q4G40_07255 [Brachybacterium sp.]|nr:hypothetical protein [Brachybacterium sp.]